MKRIYNLAELDMKTTAIDGIITCSGEVLSGTPVFKNTRVPVKNLIDYLEAGDSLNEFLDDFPSVKREQAIQALEAAKEMLLEKIHEYSH